MFASLGLLAALIAAPVAGADTPAPPDRALRVAIGVALAMIESRSGAVWPESPGAPRQILLVVGEQEFLFCPEATVAPAEHGFAPLGHDRISGCALAVRPRTQAADLLATFPMFGGVPTVVVGTPAATGWSYADWTATLLHEHVHQMQNAHPDYAPGAAALDLARGDRSGLWMLEYDFPYAEAAAGFRALADRAIAALAAEVPDFEAALEAYLAERRAFLAALDPADARYLELQLWQEGVARWSEGAIAQAAGLRWPLDAAWLAAWEARNARELAGADLARHGRPAFYALGAAEAALLERQGADWRGRYLSEPFALGRYFETEAPTAGAPPDAASGVPLAGEMQR